MVCALDMALCIRWTWTRTLPIRRTLSRRVTIGTPTVIFAVFTVFWLFLVHCWYTVGIVLVDMWRLVHQWSFVLFWLSLYSFWLFWPLVYQSSPGAITLNVVWMEREFDAYKLPRWMCPSNYNRFSDRARYWSKIVIFFIPLAFDAPVRGVTVGTSPSRLAQTN